MGLWVLKSGQSQANPWLWDCGAITRKVPSKVEESVPWVWARQAGGSILLCACPLLPAGLPQPQTPCVVAPGPA